MNLRIAIPILGASFALMLACLGIARAQQNPNQVIVTPPGQPGQPGQRPPLTPFETGLEGEDFQAMPPGARVTFNLEDADLPDLVRLISQITGKRFIITGKARSIKATVYAPTKVTASEAYQAFLSILDLNGMTVVPSGRYLKIVESAGIETNPIPLNTGTEATGTDDRYVTRMHRIENVSAEDVAQLLTRFKTREGNVGAYAPTNTVIMTDLGSNIRRMLRIVEAVDVPRAGEQVWVEPVHYANATELAQRLTEIFGVGQPAAPGAAQPVPQAPRPPGAPGAAPAVGQRSGEMRITKILADERTNSLIIVATERAYVRVLEMIRALDIALEGEGRIHVYYVQHGDADDLSSTLSALVGTGGAAGAPATPGAPPGGGTPFEGGIRINAHKATNSLVITSSLHDYAQLRNVIERLDIVRRQVFIEAVIMELSVRRSSKLGLSFHGALPNTPEAGALSILGFNAQGSITPVSQESLTSLALGVRGPTVPDSQQLIGVSIPAFGVVMNALATTGDANVLSTPHIIAMDNVEAEINVGENIPLQTNGIPGNALGGLAGLAGAIPGQAGAAGALGALGGLGGLGGGFGGGQRQDVGTKIRITPHLNDSDEIRLEIEEEISERGAAEGTLGVVSITKRNAKTQLVVRDQQTVVIGGLMRDTVNTTESKVPILGDIPLIGVLFRRTERSTQKTNLLLFLTPYIIRGPEDLRAIFERKMRERQEFLDRYFVFGDQGYEPPLDYSRTRGLLGEIFLESDMLEEEERLAAEAASAPPQQHVVRPAIGNAPEDQLDLIIEPGGSREVPTGAPPDTPAPADGSVTITPPVVTPGVPPPPPPPPQGI